ncbi:protein-L-isoaspartate(D-aspartate) O-methyltransferase [bacterium]|nr:protein-L-isoaspartate(D-aspartate) O-methyltransferase [bacterium]RQV95083.1 MAG: protein-L-isoaspartate(D-aspartate) O-methyltransferase [bacterium]
MGKRILLCFMGLFLFGLFCQQLSKEHIDMNQDSQGSFALERRRMVEEQIMTRGVEDTLVLNAMMKVERHLYVPEPYRPYAYNDEPLPIGHDQTISQPYIVAYMTEALRLKGGEKVLEIGTGSGYQAAVLAEIAREVYTIEIVEPLAKQASDILQAEGYDNVFCRCGDGYQGWPEKAPFDAIIVTAAPPRIPEPLVEQLKEGGRMIIPVGTYFQELVLLTKKDGEISKKQLIPVRFVPMTGEIQKK